MLNVAIMGLGYIAARVAHGVRCSTGANLYAVASRRVPKAKDFADAHNVDVWYGSYEEVVADERVDIVYICTPNPLHEEHIKLCLDAHKHVICEKPMCSSSAQIHALFAYAKARGCFLMEAHKCAFTPLNQEIKKRIHAGAIGALTMIDASYCGAMEFEDYNPSRWNFDPLRGGSLFDVGVYPLCFANFYADADVVEWHVVRQENHELHCDFNGAGILKYNNGVIASVRSSWDVGALNRGSLYGTKGYIEIENFWKSTNAFLIKGDVREKIEVPMESDFSGEIEHAVQCIEAGLLESAIMGEHQSIEICKVIENKSA